MNTTFLGSLTCVAMPPPVYAPYADVSSSSMKEYAFTFLMRRGLPSLSSVIQGLTLVHFSAEPQHFLRDALGDFSCA